jgi:N-acetylglutamate synthase/N-acetylornithine aminotransferase
MLEALTMPVILLALANGIRQWRAMRERQSQRDEVQQLLALLCERLHEQLERDGTPPRTVINLTAGQWHEVSKR